MKILFVCSGNICRSPMAAAYLRHRAGELSVDSAGTLGIRGAPASVEALCVLSELGVDASAHRSKGIDEVDLAAMDLIVGMDREHLSEIEAVSPGSSARCRLIRAFENGPDPVQDVPDLEDPIGRSVEFYRRQLGLIVKCVDHLVDHLRSGPDRAVT